MPISNPLRIKTLLAAASIAGLSATAALASPPFWGATYAYTTGPSDPASMTGGTPVHVAARLPINLECMGFVGAQLQDGPPYPRVADSLRAAPVVVTLEPGSCPEPGRDRWLKFVVPHPYQADILELVYVSVDGKALGSEKVSISDNGSGSYGGGGD